MKSVQRLVQHQSANGTLNQHSLGMSPTIYNITVLCLSFSEYLKQPSNESIGRNVGPGLVSSGMSQVRALVILSFYSALLLCLPVLLHEDGLSEATILAILYTKLFEL